jgi:large subunit ribosomal protein L17
MRHRNGNTKLGRSSSHHKAMMAALVCGLIKDRRIKTTVSKAKLARSMAEKMVTLGRAGTLAARRQAIAKLRREDIVTILFDEIAPMFDGRNGGYTRIMKLGRRSSDGSEMAILEWVESTIAEEVTATVES